MATKKATEVEESVETEATEVNPSEFISPRARFLVYLSTLLLTAVSFGVLEVCVHAGWVAEDLAESIQTAITTMTTFIGSGLAISNVPTITAKWSK